MPIVKRVKDIPKTAQGIFEYVLDHLKKQGKRATGAGPYCEYRTSDGLSCAVGCLIPHHRMKYTGTGSVHMLRYEALGPELLPYLDLLSSLQNFHDYVWLLESTDRQIQHLQDIAEWFNLTLPEWVIPWLHKCNRKDNQE